jgi:hypothetical protein
MGKTKDGKLTVRQRKFVANKVKGMTNHEAYLKAGYQASSYNIARNNSSKLMAKDNIQQAIDTALEYHGATPEFAVGRLKAIAGQDKELGASRLASKDILELHGWRRGEKPQLQIQVNGFFGESRTIQSQADH